VGPLVELMSSKFEVPSFRAATGACMNSQQRPKFRVRAATIVCTDSERSGRFYSKILGAEPLPQEEPGVCRWYRLGSFEITFVPNADVPTPASFGAHPMTMLWLEVYDIRAAHEHVVAHGVPILGYDEVQWLMIADPDGLPIEVWKAGAATQT
jgi:catechol 2,3-dioxygenase-like lactoylglutathione lyase family enzyme